MQQTIILKDPLNGIRTNYPVFFTVKDPKAPTLMIGRLSTGAEVLCQKLAQSPAGESRYVAAVSFTGETELTLERPAALQDLENFVVFHELPARESDCFVRLNTGCFDLELCSGRAEGRGSSKWGIKHFKNLSDGVELMPSGNNALGGFYGPFFTPENGLINPPEHTKVQIETVENGPVYRFYRMHGVIPDGLLPELCGKKFTIEWQFFAGVPYFERRYLIDDFKTVINGRSVVNKITVGDEFESGQGKLLFDRFETYNGVCYRGGDPYALELVKMVADTVNTSAADNPKFLEFKEQLKDMQSAHWDLYWRLFSAWEGVLDREEISRRLTSVRAQAHVLADLPTRPWKIADGAADVNAVPDETVFQGPAGKSAEYDSVSGRCLVWWTSQPSGAFQIVQRRKSGWVNWGTNGENECPELPVGVRIKTAYGHFADHWKQVADLLEHEIMVEYR